MEQILHRGRWLAIGLLWAALRTFFADLDRQPADLFDPVAGAQTSLPDLQHDGWIPLTWLPGVGETKARAIVRARARWSVPLTPSRLRWMPGIGENTARQIVAWYEGGGVGPPAPPG